MDYERAVVVDADGERKRTRPLSEVNGGVCEKNGKRTRQGGNGVNQELARLVG
jgi:hypothetical protein